MTWTTAKVKRLEARREDIRCCTKDIWSKISHFFNVWSMFVLSLLINFSRAHRENEHVGIVSKMEVVSCKKLS